MVLHSAHILCLASVAQIRLILTGYCLLHHSSCQHWSWPGYQLGGCMPGPGNARGMKHFQTLPQNYKIPFYYSSSSVKTLHETKEKLSSLIFPCQYLSCVWIAIWNKNVSFTSVGLWFLSEGTWPVSQAAGALSMLTQVPCYSCWSHNPRSYSSHTVLLSWEKCLTHPVPLLYLLW